MPITPCPCWVAEKHFVLLFLLSHLEYSLHPALPKPYTNPHPTPVSTVCRVMRIHRNASDLEVCHMLSFVLENPAPMKAFLLPFAAVPYITPALPIHPPNLTISQGQYTPSPQNRRKMKDTASSPFPNPAKEGDFGVPASPGQSTSASVALSFSPIGAFSQNADAHLGKPPVISIDDASSMGKGPLEYPIPRPLLLPYPS